MVKVYFLGAQDSLKMWGPLLRLGTPTQQHLAVCAEVVKGHTLWHMYTANNCNIVARNNGTTYMFGALECAFTCLGAPEC